MAKGRHELRAARTTWPLIVGLVAGVLLLALGGVAFAAYRYEQANADRILMGTTVAGIDVSGMTRAEAIAAVRGGVRDDLRREIAVVVGGAVHGHALAVGTPGAGPAGVDEAMNASTSVGWLERAWRRP